MQALALVLVPWIQYARPRLLGRPAALPVSVAAGLVAGALGVWLYNSHILSTVKTLNETFLALTLLLPYVTLRRPLNRFTALPTVFGVLIGTVLLEQTAARQVTTNVAEGVLMLMLVPLVLDVFDRGILDPARPSPRASRLLSAAGLIVVPLLVVALRHAPLGHVPHLVVDYTARAQEAFVGTLLVMLYFAIRRPAGIDGGRPAAVPDHRSAEVDARSPLRDAGQAARLKARALRRQQKAPGSTSAYSGVRLTTASAPDTTA